MEQYLQELDKINELLVHTNMKPAPFWSFLLSYPWLCLGVVLFVVIIFRAEETNYVITRHLSALAVILGIGVIIFIISLITELTTSKHDLISVTKDSYVEAINYVADLPDDKFQQSYENTKRYEFTDAQFKEYNASRTIIQDYYNKIYKK